MGGGGAGMVAAVMFRQPMMGPERQLPARVRTGLHWAAEVYYLESEFARR